MAVCAICQRAHATANHARLVRRGSVRTGAARTAPTPTQAAAATPVASTVDLTQPLDSAAIVQAINSLAGLLAPTDSHVITFSRSIPAIIANVEQQRIPFDANILAVFIHFPPGTNQLVEVRLVATIGGALHYVVPTKEDAYIALDDSFIPFQGLRFAMPAGSVLQAEWYNYDGANAHTVPITVVIGIVGRVGGVALPPSEFIPALERPLVPPTTTPGIPVRATPIQLPSPPAPALPPIPPITAPILPTPTAPPSISSLGVSISPRVTRANSGESREITLSFTSNMPTASSATDISVPIAAKVFLTRNNAIVQDYGRVSFDLQPGQTTPINMRFNAPRDAGLYSLRIIAGLQARFNENMPGSWLAEQIIPNILEVLAQARPSEQPSLTIRRPEISSTEVQPGEAISAVFPIEIARAPVLPANLSAPRVQLVGRGRIIDEVPISLTGDIGTFTRSITLRIPNDAEPGTYGIAILTRDTPPRVLANFLGVLRVTAKVVQVPPVQQPQREAGFVRSDIGVRTRGGTEIAGTTISRDFAITNVSPKSGAVFVSIVLVNRDGQASGWVTERQRVSLQPASDTTFTRSFVVPATPGDYSYQFYIWDPRTFRDGDSSTYVLTGLYGGTLDVRAR